MKKLAVLLGAFIAQVSIAQDYVHQVLVLNEGYKLISKNITYNIIDGILSSNHLSIFTDDEGNNMAIIRLMLRLDDEPKQVGGRVLGLLGNHELMNVDKDFRYVSPKEFLEFVPVKDRTSKYTEDGYPLGYYHRKKAFERGSNLSKIYAIKKKSIMTIGNFLFVHGGLSQDLVNKYTIAEINTVISKWLSNQSNNTEEKVFDEIFRDDDDMSPFWCRIFAEEVLQLFVIHF